MTIKSWLETAMQDADRRGLPELKPLLEALAKATSALRSADWNDDASGDTFALAHRRPEGEGGDPESRLSAEARRAKAETPNPGTNGH